MTLDRIIFLRICEDRGIEPYGQLQRAAEHGEVYAELRRLFQLADARYNSGLFHFKDEKDQSSQADRLTLGLTIDDKTLQGILKHLYAPDCPYVFSVIPTEILGQVYEQFLGKVIRLTAGHQAKVEEKPEVRKAGGVYYTPTYIVDYIVKNTVGKLLEGKTPAEAARAERRWTRPAAPDRSCWARISACWTGTCSGTANMIRRSMLRARRRQSSCPRMAGSSQPRRRKRSC